MDVIIGEPDDYCGVEKSAQKSEMRTPKRRQRDGGGVPVLDLVDASVNLRASMGNGVGMSRTIGMKQSRSNVASGRRINTQNNASSPDRKGSPEGGNLFRKNKETLEMMLIRKLKGKYIDSNLVYAILSEELPTSSFNLLQNNYTSNTSGSRRYNPNSSIEYGSVPARNTSMKQGRTRNANSKQRYTVGSSINVLPSIQNPGLGDLTNPEQSLQFVHKTP